MPFAGVLSLMNKNKCIHIRFYTEIFFFGCIQLRDGFPVRRLITDQQGLPIRSSDSQMAG